MNETLCLDAEQSVLASMMMQNLEAISAVVEILGETGAAFSQPEHAEWYEAIVARWRKGLTTDTVALLRTMNDDDVIRWGRYIAGLFDVRKTSAFAKEDAEIVAEKYLQRTMAEKFRIATVQARSGKVSNAEIMQDAETALRELGIMFFRQQVKPIHLDLIPAIDELNCIMNNNGALPGVPSGIASLDSITSGWKAGELIVIGARPATGKTAFVLNCLVAASMQKVDPLFFSLEMSTRQLLHRMLGIIGGVSIGNIYKGFGAANEISKIRAVAEKLEQTPIYGVNIEGGITIAEIRSKAYMFRNKHPNCIIGVDYLQLVRPPAGVKDRYMQVAEISRNLNEMARGLGVPVLAAAQLSRQAEKETDPHAMQAALRESGNIEADADVVIILRRLSEGERDSLKSKGKNPDDFVGCSVTKNRQGQTGNVYIEFRKHTQQMLAEGVQGKATFVRNYTESHAEEFDEFDNEEVPF